MCAMNEEQTSEFWRWAWGVDNRPTYERLSDWRACVIYHRSGPYSVAEVRRQGDKNPEIEEIYVGRINPLIGRPRPEEIVKRENRIDLSVENPLNLIIARAMSFNWPPPD